MKKLLPALLLLFMGSVSFGQTATVRGNRLTLEGKLAETVSLPPACGTIAWATVLEFEITQFSDASYTLPRIGVIVTCPEFYEKGFFEKGKTYRLELADENQADFGWSIPNESVLQQYALKNRLFVLSAKKL